MRDGNPVSDLARASSAAEAGCLGRARHCLQPAAEVEF